MMAYFFEEIYRLGVFHAQGTPQLTLIDADAATRAGIELKPTDGREFAALFHSPVFQKDVDHFGRNVHIPGKR